MNSLFAVVSLRLSKISPDVKYQFFVDDSKNRANIKSFDQMMDAKKEREIFNELAGLILNPTKCIAWGSSDKARKLARQLIPAQGRLVKYFPSLGYVVNTTKGIRRIEMDQKCLKADKVLDKIAKLPNTKKNKELYIASTVIPKITYGCNVCLPSRQVLNNLTCKILKVFWSTDQKLREPSFVFLTNHRAHKLHPKLACYWECLHNIRKCMIGYPELRNQIANHWDKAKRNKPGPISVIKTIFHELECDLGDNWNITCDCLSFNFIQISQQQWGHNIRKIFKRFLMRNVKKRKD